MMVLIDELTVDGLDRPPSIAEWEDASCGSGSSLDLVKMGKNNTRQLSCVTLLLNNQRDRLAKYSTGQSAAASTACSV